jgi:hypothetical protein
VLPLINQRWARLLRGPSRAWQVVWIGSTRVNDGSYYEQQTDDETQLDAATVLA